MNLKFVDNVEHWPLDRLMPHARNSRTHSEAQVAQIAGSIAELGFVNPVLAGDGGVIVAGHERATRDSSKSRAIVLDLFGGSGSTMIAAERSGRRARLVELDPKYVGAIVQRRQSLTGGNAVHAPTVRRFQGRKDRPGRRRSGRGLGPRPSRTRASALTAS